MVRELPTETAALLFSTLVFTGFHNQSRAPLLTNCPTGREGGRGAGIKEGSALKLG